METFRLCLIIGVFVVIVLYFAGAFIALETFSNKGSELHLQYTQIDWSKSGASERADYLLKEMRRHIADYEELKLQNPMSWYRLSVRKYGKVAQ